MTQKSIYDFVRVGDILWRTPYDQTEMNKLYPEWFVFITDIKENGPWWTITGFEMKTKVVRTGSYLITDFDSKHKLVVIKGSNW